MSTVAEVRTVQTALDEIGRWRSDEETRQKSELVEVDEEIGKLRAAIQNMQQQLEALESFRGDLLERGGGLEGLEIEKAYDAIFAALTQQAKGLATRAGKAAEANKARDAAALDALAKSPVGHLVSDYRQFKETVEPTLKAIPETYRGLIIEKHAQVAKQIQDWVAANAAGPAPVEKVDGLDVEVVFGVDAPDDAPELLIAVLPITDDVHANWVGRDEDLLTFLASRTVQAIYQTVKVVGPPGAQVMSGGHRGLLALEAEVVGARSDVAKVLAEQLVAVYGAAPELAAAKVKVTVREVSVDYLLPPEDAEEAEEARETVNA